ncbi:hypothetical protein ACWU4D_02875 [Vibrio sp. WJH972]
MKKFFIIAGIVFTILLAVATVAVGLLVHKGSALDEESQKYVNTVTPEVLSSLDKETLFLFADRELINSATSDEFDKLFRKFRELGTLRSFNPSIGEANINFNDSNMTITGSYVMKAEFENGEAMIKVTVIKRGDEWKVIGFYIDSPIYLN